MQVILDLDLKNRGNGMEINQEHAVRRRHKVR